MLDLTKFLESAHSSVVWIYMPRSPDGIRWSMSSTDDGKITQDQLDLEQVVNLTQTDKRALRMKVMITSHGFIYLSVSLTVRVG